MLLEMPSHSHEHFHFCNVTVIIADNTYEGIYWFSVELGLKQGCIITASLFNLYLNGLVARMKKRGLGVEVDGLMVSLLLYTNDVAILAESEQDGQYMFNALHEWTQVFDKVVCFRIGYSILCTEAVFILGDGVVWVVDRYHYLGLVLTQLMDLNITVKYVA